MQEKSSRIVDFFKIIFMQVIILEDFSSKVVLDRLKKLLNIKTDDALARHLGLSGAAIGMWKARNTFDVKLIFTKCEGIDWNYIIYGNHSDGTASPQINLIESNAEKDSLNPSETQETTKLKAQIELLRTLLKEKDEELIELRLLERRRKERDFESGVVRIPVVGKG